MQFPSDLLSRSYRSTDWEKRRESLLITCADLDSATHLPKGADNWEKEMVVESDRDCMGVATEFEFADDVVTAVEQENEAVRTFIKDWRQEEKSL